MLFRSGIKMILLDGQPIEHSLIPTNITGAHKLKIVLNKSFKNEGKLNMVKNEFSPSTPLFNARNEHDSSLTWSTSNAESYGYFMNGKFVQALEGSPVLKIPASESFVSFQVQGIGINNHTSFLSAPFEYAPDNIVSRFEAEDFAARSVLPFKGFEGKGFVEISKNKNRELIYKINLQRPGWYRVQFRYANGNGPINTENKCAIRSVYLDNGFLGSIVFPQRGTNEWSDWGFSNSLKVRMRAGNCALSLRFEDWNENMNQDINQALIDYLRLTYLGD